MLCILGFHKWTGCTCVRCGKIRNEQHDWNADRNKCSKCGFTITASQKLDIKEKELKSSPKIYSTSEEKNIGVKIMDHNLLIELIDLIHSRSKVKIALGNEIIIGTLISEYGETFTKTNVFVGQLNNSSTRYPLSSIVNFLRKSNNNQSPTEIGLLLDLKQLILSNSTTKEKFFEYLLQTIKVIGENHLFYAKSPSEKLGTTIDQLIPKFETLFNLSNRDYGDTKFRIEIDEYHISLCKHISAPGLSSIKIIDIYKVESDKYYLYIHDVR